MRTLAAVLTTAVLTALLATAQDDQKNPPPLPLEPKALFAKADAATKKIKSAEYDCTFEVKMAGPAPKLAAHVKGAGAGEGGFKKMHIEGEVTPPAGEKRKATVIADGENYALLDPAKKIAYIDIDPIILGQLGGFITQRAVLLEFGHPTPFQDEVNAVKHEYKGTEKIGDEDCWIIHVRYTDGGDGPQTIWAISQKDYLPRRCERIFSQNGQSGRTVQTLTNLKVNPDFDKAVFKVAAPEGYETTDTPEMN